MQILKNLVVNKSHNSVFPLVPRFKKCGELNTAEHELSVGKKYLFV